MVHIQKEAIKVAPFFADFRVYCKGGEGLLQCSRTRDEIYVRSPFIRCNVESINQDLLGSFLSERRRDFWHQKICSMYLPGKSCRNVNFNQEETLFLDSKVVPKKTNIRIESVGSIIIFKMKKNKKGCTTHFSKRSQYINLFILSLHTYFPLHLALKISINSSTNRAVHHNRWYY